MDGRPASFVGRYNCSRSQAYLKVLPDVDRKWGGEPRHGAACSLLTRTVSSGEHSAEACSAAGSSDGVRKHFQPSLSLRGSWSWVS